MTLNLINGSYQISLTDDSQITSTTNYTTAGTLYYNLISGSAGAAATAAPNASIYGYMYPDSDIIILNPTALSKSVIEGGIAFDPVVSNPGTNNNIQQGFYQIMSASANFSLQSAENVSAHYFFTRVKNQDFNCLNDPM